MANPFKNVTARVIEWAIGSGAVKATEPAGGTSDALARIVGTVPIFGMHGIGTRERAVELVSRLKGFVFTATEMRAKGYARLESRIREVNPHDAKVITDITTASIHWWAQQLITRPYRPLPWITLREIKKGLSRNRDVFGAAVLWTPTNGADVPVQMLNLPPNLVFARSRGQSLVDYWELRTPFGIVELDKKEVCYIPRLGATVDIYRSLVDGQSLIRMGLDQISGGEAMQEFIRNVFDFGGIPPALVKTQAIPGVIQPTKEENQATLRIWLENYQSRNGAVPIGIMPPGWDIQMMGIAEGIDQMIANAKELKGDFFELCGIPRTYADQAATTYATAQVTKYVFQSETMEPEAAEIDEAVERHLNQFVRPGQPLLKYDHAPFIYEDQTETRAQEQHEIQNGIKTRNAARAERGWDAYTSGGGDLLTVQAGTVPLEMVGTPTGQAVSNVSLSATPEAKAMLSHLFAEDPMYDEIYLKSAGVDSDPFRE